MEIKTYTILVLKKLGSSRWLKTFHQRETIDGSLLKNGYHTHSQLIIRNLHILPEIEISKVWSTDTHTVYHNDHKRKPKNTRTILSF